MKVTVIIPAYNRADFLEYSITSLLRQRDVVDLDLLVIDDGSTDETPQLMGRLMAEEPALRYLRQENGGVAKARNCGLDNLLPETELVTFLDSDDISPLGRFAADLPLFDEDPTLDITYGRLLYIERLDRDALEPAADSRSVDMRGIQLACIIIRRSFLERVGNFDEEFVQAEDTDFLLRVFEAAPNYKVTDTSCVYYLRHPGNITKRIDEGRRFFMRALHKSVLRRKADPSIKSVGAIFENQNPERLEFY